MVNGARHGSGQLSWVHRAEREANSGSLPKATLCLRWSGLRSRQRVLADVPVEILMPHFPFPHLLALRTFMQT